MPVQANQAMDPRPKIIPTSDRPGTSVMSPGLSDVGMIFGLGSIAWFAWTGIVLLRHPTATAPVAEVVAR